jgi:hypothetical protein
LEPSLQSEHADSAPANETTAVKPVPHGVGMAVAFDWGIAVQILVLPLLPLLLPNLSPFRLSELKIGSLPTWAASFLISLPFAALVFIFGESIRRGWNWGRRIQIVANSVGFLGGIATLANLWQDSKAGNYWSVVPSVILLIFSPLIAMQLSRRSTARWFATVSGAEAARRHGGLWPWLIAIWSLVGGILQAIAASQR